MNQSVFTSAGSTVTARASPRAPTSRIAIRAMEFIRDVRDQPMSLGAILELHRVITADTLTNAGDAGRPLVLPASNLTVIDHECDARTILLPALTLDPGDEPLIWVAFDGATYEAKPGQADPDFTTRLRGPDLPWVTHQPGYVVEVVAEGFRLPVNIAFVPEPGPAPDDPLFYVTELYGTIRVVSPHS